MNFRWFVLMLKVRCLTLLNLIKYEFSIRSENREKCRYALNFLIGATFGTFQAFFLKKYVSLKSCKCEFGNTPFIFGKQCVYTFNFISLSCCLHLNDFFAWKQTLLDIRLWPESNEQSELYIILFKE